MWEYTTAAFNSLFDTEKSIKMKSDIVLEQHGKVGWELVNFQCVGGFGSMMVFIFKREKKESVVPGAECKSFSQG